nr:uncharacterized protein LOC113822167 [Penaeus vannamei]
MKKKIPLKNTCSPRRLASPLTAHTEAVPPANLSACSLPSLIEQIVGRRQRKICRFIDSKKFSNKDRCLIRQSEIQFIQSTIHLLLHLRWLETAVVFTNNLTVVTMSEVPAEGEGGARRRGTYGRVVRVSYKGKECALKLAAPDSQVTFQHELEMLKRLQGAGGAPVPLAYSEEPSRLLMTYLGKETLADVLSARRSPKQLLQVSLKLVEAVAAVHAAGIVHCDLKPTNVMVQLRGAGGAPTVHVIDFGLALPVGQCHPKSSQGRHSWYCACVHEGTAVTSKCDVVSVGVILQFVSESMLKAPPAALQARCGASAAPPSTTSAPRSRRSPRRSRHAAPLPLIAVGRRRGSVGRQRRSDL